MTVVPSGVRAGSGSSPSMKRYSARSRACRVASGGRRSSPIVRSMRVVRAASQRSIIASPGAVASVAFKGWPRTIAGARRSKRGTRRATMERTASRVAGSETVDWKPIAISLSLPGGGCRRPRLIPAPGASVAMQCLPRATEGSVARIDAPPGLGPMVRARAPADCDPPSIGIESSCFVRGPDGET